MRESLGGSLLLYIVLFFIGLIILFFAAIMSYAKAYRVKNRIINYLENANYYNDNGPDYYDLNAGINSELQGIGYSYKAPKKCNFNNKCSQLGVSEHNENLNNKSFKGGKYNYCLCKVTLPDNSYYFEVITFTEFEFPIIKSVIRSSVHGETKILGKEYKDYEYVED